MAIETALKNAEKTTMKTQKEADINDQMAKNLETRMRNLRMETDRQLAAKERMLLMHENMSREMEDRVRKLESKLIKTTQDVNVFEEEAERWRKRCLLLEKTRRIGYYRPGTCTTQYHVSLCL